MTKPTAKYEFDELVQLAAQDQERNQLELKSSSFVLTEYCANGKKQPQSKNELRTRLKEMLGKEVGAFANSAGGTLVIGLNDNGTIDQNQIPEYWEFSKTKIEDWVADVLRESLDAPLENFDCYALTDEGGSSRIIVIQMPVSEKAPHQSKADKRYYTRQGKSAKAAENWLIEAIRNRKIHPLIVPELQSGLSRIDELKSENIKDSKGQGRLVHFAILDLRFYFINVGKVIAQSWGFRVECPIARTLEIPSPGLFGNVPLPVASPSGTVMRQANSVLFPTQCVEAYIRPTVPIYISAASPNPGCTLSNFQWSGIKDNPEAGANDGHNRNKFFLTIWVYGDSAPAKKYSFEINSIDLWKSAEEVAKQNPNYLKSIS